ncbi:MAG: nitroreductase [Desulfobulbaceae bacterium]|nr:nitroreductase [Desulfobulbaceae bacterium]
MDDLIRSRRSIRRFQEKNIEPDKMDQLFEAARWAPSWGNLQCCELVVVEEAEDKKKLASLLSPKNPATKCMEKAPVVIAVCGMPGKSGYYNNKQITRYQHWFLYDLGLVSQNICLKASELGLGTVIVGSFDHVQAEQLLSVPDGCELVALIPLGYPDHAPSAPKRKAISEFVHFGKFNQS